MSVSLPSHGNTTALGIAWSLSQLTVMRVVHTAYSRDSTYPRVIDTVKRCLPVGSSLKCYRTLTDCVSFSSWVISMHRVNLCADCNFISTFPSGHEGCTREGVRKTAATSHSISTRRGLGRSLWSLLIEAKKNTRVHMKG